MLRSFFRGGFLRTRRANRARRIECAQDGKRMDIRCSEFMEAVKILLGGD